MKTIPFDASPHALSKIAAPRASDFFPQRKSQSRAHEKFYCQHCKQLSTSCLSDKLIFSTMSILWNTGIPQPSEPSGLIPRCQHVESPHPPMMLFLSLKDIVDQRLIFRCPNATECCLHCAQGVEHLQCIAELKAGPGVCVQVSNWLKEHRAQGHMLHYATTKVVAYNVDDCITIKCSCGCGNAEADEEAARWLPIRQTFHVGLEHTKTYTINERPTLEIPLF